MAAQQFFRLADSTAIEPLIDRWLAWSHLMSPITASLHTLNYTLPTLSSYLQSPRTHVQACRSPKLLGGPFVDVPIDRAPEVKEFYQDCETKHRDRINLATSLIAFQKLLNEYASGQSLEPFYEQIPEVLKGYVELVYDYYDRPIVRCIEALLYASPYYKECLQSVRMFSLKHDKARAFFLSTPRLPDHDRIEWSVPFESEAIDQLFELDSRPKPLEEIRELIGASSADTRILARFLSSDPLPIAREWRSPGVRLRYLGHAAVLIEWRGVTILTDPLVPITPTENGIDRFTFRDLPQTIDFVVITHGHSDHFVFESLLRLRRRIGCIVVPRSSGIYYGDVSLKLLAGKLGFRQVIEVDSLEAIPIPGGQIIAVPFLGEHGDLPHGKSGYVVRAGRQQILFAADANCLDKRMYEHVRQCIGQVQTAFIGMECVGAPFSWFYGSILPSRVRHSNDKSRRLKGCNAETALELLRALGSERVYVYALGREPWLEYMMALAPSDTDPQLVEARKLLSRAGDEGWRDAKCLFGTFELELTDV